MHLLVRSRVALAVAFSAVLVLQACNDNSVPAPPSISGAARPVAALFVDAASGLPVSAPVSVTIRDSAGALSQVSRDVSGSPATSFTTTNGVVTFQVDPAATLPVQLSVIASASGFTATSAPVTVSADGGASVQVKMVSLAAPPPGVAVVQAQAGAADATGVTTAAATVSTTPNANSTTGMVTLTVPAATKVTAADGTPLTGQLQATVTFFDAKSTNALTALPGGPEMTVSTGTGTTSGVFVAAGFAAITITDSTGKQAASFSQPITVEIVISADTQNPNTGAAVQAGDTIPLFSYNETTGTWKQEQDAVIQTASGGGLKAVGTLNHLTYAAVGSVQKTCNMTVQLTGAPSGFDYSSMQVLVAATKGGFATSAAVGTDGSAAIKLPTSATSVNVTATYGGASVGSGSTASACGSTVSVSVNIPVTASLTVTFQQRCIEDNTKVTAIPSAPVTAQQLNPAGPLYTQFTDKKGVATFNSVVAGKNYNVGATYNGKTATAQTTLAAGSNSVALYADVQCVKTGGGGQSK